MSTEPGPRTSEQTKAKRRVVPQQYVHCRIFGHAWEYTTVKREGKALVQGLRCIRCATDRYVYVDARTGDRGANRYLYPENYQLSDGGPMTPRERSSLRLNEIRRHLK